MCPTTLLYFPPSLTLNHFFRKNAITLGHHFDCPMSSSKEMVDCLRKIPTEKLHDAHVDLFFDWHKYSTERQPMNVFSPRSDPEAGPEAFLPEHPYVAMKKGIFSCCQLAAVKPKNPIITSHFYLFLFFFLSESCPFTCHLVLLSTWTL